MRDIEGLKILDFGSIRQGGYAPLIGATASGLPTTISIKVDSLGNTMESVPLYYFVKDILHVGHYEHPLGRWKKEITQEKLDEYVTTFAAMKANGVKIPFVVDHSSNVADGRGEVIDMFRDGDKLIAKIRVAGEDAAMQTASVPEVSVEINNVIDGNGNKYGEAIEAVSHSQFPVLPNQQSFVPVAASRRRGVALHLSAAKRRASMKLDPEQKAKLQKLCVDSGKTVDEIAAMTDDDLISFGLETLLGASDPAAQAEAMSKVQSENTDLKQQLSRRPAEVAPPNEEVLYERGIRVKGRLDQLIADQLIDPATGEKLLARLTKQAGKANAFMLSRHGDASDCEAMELIEILAANKPSPVGEKSGQQVRELSRYVPNDSEKADKPMTDERRTYVRSLLGLPGKHK
jgi:hypothetical protein